MAFDTEIAEKFLKASNREKLRIMQQAEGYYQEAGFIIISKAELRELHSKLHAFENAKSEKQVKKDPKLEDGWQLIKGKGMLQKHVIIAIKTFTHMPFTTVSIIKEFENLKVKLFTNNPTLSINAVLKRLERDDKILKIEEAKGRHPAIYKNKTL